MTTNDHDSALRARFARQRDSDHQHAPAWRPELLERPAQPRHAPPQWRLFAAATTACVIFAVILITGSTPPAPLLSDLPPLLHSAPGELFADLAPSFIEFRPPSDFLLPNHIQTSLP